jgi:hypothetical protein
MPLKVDFQRPEYAEALPKWDLVDDCDSGQQSIKRETTDYLPKPNPTDLSSENDARYEAYLLRAVFANYCQRTITGLVGQVYSKQPTVKLPPILDQLIDNVDGTGISLDQQSRKAVRSALKTGRGALLVDYPLTSGEVKKADAVAASIICYDPKSVINWRIEKVGNQNKYTLIVIEESVTKVDPEDIFRTSMVKQWQVLELIEGVYTRSRWEKVKGVKGEMQFQVIEDSISIPRKGNGQTWDQIPFTFIGANNNDSEIDQSPTYDLAILNIGHYRNSADYEESVFVVGQPMYLISGLTQGWVDENFKEGFQVGSRRALMLPAGGSGAIVQPAANSLAFEAMRHKEEQMVRLGAKIVEASGVQRTATEAGMDEASENSVLSNVARNVSAAYEQALLWAWEYMESAAGNSDDIVYELNSDYEISALDPQLLAGVIQAWQSGALTESEMRKKLEKTNLAFEDFNDWRDQLDDNPAGLPSANEGGIN